MTEDLKQFIFKELEEHIDELDNLIQGECELERQEYHLTKIRCLTTMLKQNE